MSSPVPTFAQMMNVPDGERAASAALGAGLVVAGLRRGGVTRLLLLFAGGAMLRRAWSGHCPLYTHLALDKRHARPGVPGNRGVRLEAAVEVSCPASSLFHFWRDVHNLPRILRRVKSVEARGGGRSHWRVAGPAGKTFAWDAEIINEEEDRMIAWQSLPGAAVRNAGSVWFEPTADGATRVKLALEYDPPAGAFGVAIAGLFGRSPEAEMTEDLQRFKALAEAELPGGTAHVALARLLWEQDGQPEGRAEEHWRRAEEQLRRRR